MRKFSSKIVFGLMFFAALVCTNVAQGEIIYESTTLGQVGLTGGIAVAAGFDDYMETDYYAGARFHLDYEAEVTAIGGHFLLDNDNTGNLFGAILPLSGPGAMPSLDFLDVIASTIFVPDSPSSDYRTSLAVTLQPGDYALIFGSNALGSADGIMNIIIAADQQRLDGGDLIQAEADGSWSAEVLPARFVIEGTVNVPEPATLILFGLGGILLRKRR